MAEGQGNPANAKLVKGAGCGTREWREDFQLLDADGTALFKVEKANGNVTVAGTLTADAVVDGGGAVELSSTLEVDGAVTLNDALTVAGAAAVAGTLTGLAKVESLAAAGNAQGNAGAVVSTTFPVFVHVTGADATKGIVLPAAAAGKVVHIKNSDAANAVLKVYPASGDAINALAGDASLDMAAKKSCTLIALDGTTWYSIPLLPS